MCASVCVVKLRPHLRATLSLFHYHFIAVARHSGNKIINISVSTDLSELKYGEINTAGMVLAKVIAGKPRKVT